MTTRPAHDDDLYERLGVPRDATPDEIKKAGRKKQKQHHPDRGGDAEAFMACHRALVVLLDPDKRRHYDATGEEQAGSQEEMERAETHSAIVQYLNVCMDGDPRYTDLPRMMRDKIGADLGRTEHEIAGVVANKDRTILKIETYLKRIRKRPDGDVIGMLLTAQMDALRRDGAQQEAILQRKANILRRALELLDGYEYEVMVDPRSQTQGQAIWQIIQQQAQSEGFWSR